MEAKKVKLDLSPTISDLPNEMLLKIFSFLPENDHHVVGLVSKHFQALIDNTKWGVETPVLEITENNVLKVKAAIENKNIKCCFKRVKIWNVKNIKDLENILQSIGQQIEYLSMSFTPATHLLKNNVKYLKSFEIYFNNDFDKNVNDGSFNINCFPLLEELCLMNRNDVNWSTNELLKQLKSATNKSRLKQFKMKFNRHTVEYLMDCLLHHANTLESLVLKYSSKDIENFKNWNISFSLMQKLKKLCLTGHFTPEMLNVIFSALPNESPLEHLKLGLLYIYYSNLDYNEILTSCVDKWRSSLQYLELSYFNQLNDVVVMEFGKLQNLRVLKLSDCEKITKMGLLAGIAMEQNIFMDELHLESLPDLDESGLRVIISRFPNLRVLTLNNLNKAITNTSLASIWCFSIRLRSLTIDCSNLTDEGFIGFGNEPCSINRLRLLVKLTLMDCRYLTDRTLIESLKLPALRSLELRDCPKITLKGIENLVKACPLLQNLSLPSTLFTNDNALFVIGNGLKRLRQLNITDSYLLTGEEYNNTTDVFAALQDSTTNATFSPDCKLKI